jgi:hypothetical protein
VGCNKSITLLEGSQASPALLSGRRSSVKIKIAMKVYEEDIRMVTIVS